MTDQKAVITEEPVWIDPSLILRSRPVPPEGDVVIPIVPKPAYVPAPYPDTLIVNIETLGFKPWESRIITIGFQDVETPDIEPTVYMLENEAEMLQRFLTFFKTNGYKKIVAYNGSFDFRYIIARCMLHGIPCKEFYEAEVIDMMRAMKYGRLTYLWGDQPAGSLDAWGTFFFNYPKPFTDLKMIEYYLEGKFDQVMLFATQQITRTMMLWKLYRSTTETFIESAPIASSIGLITSPSQGTASTTTTPHTEVLKCPACLQEFAPGDVSPGQPCPICKTIL